MGATRVSERGSGFTQHHEGFVPRYYLDPVGIGTIGTGFTWRSAAFRRWWEKNRPGQKFGPGATITRSESAEVLRLLMDEEYGAAVLRALGTELEQHQLDGAASVTFNAGAATLSDRWAQAAKAGDWSGAAELLKTTRVTARGRRLAGLVTRRRDEAELIELGDYTIGRPAVSRADAMADGVLERGEKGPDVRDLQSALVALGHYDGVVDEIFGYGTEAAVMEFQRSAGLEDDGYAGPKTLRAIAAAVAGRAQTSQPSQEPTAPAEPAPPVPVTRETVSKVQELLRDRGYPEVGRVDGLMGDRTRSAILAFQVDQSLELTGVVTDELLAALVRAPHRHVSKERAQATKVDLLDAKSVQQGELLRKGGLVTAAGGLVTGVVNGTVSADDVLGQITTGKLIWSALGAAAPWLALAAGGAIVAWFGVRFVREQVRAYREGRHV